MIFRHLRRFPPHRNANFATRFRCGQVRSAMRDPSAAPNLLIGSPGCGD